MDSRQRFRLDRPRLVYGGHAGMPGVKLRFPNSQHKKRSRMLQATTPQQASGASLWKRAYYNLPPGSRWA